MPDFVILFVLLGLVGAWFVSEFRNIRFIRICLVLTIIFVLLAGIAIVIDSCERRLTVYHMVLGQIERRTEKTNLKKLNETLKAYEELYSKTGDHKLCSLWLINKLLENNQEPPDDEIQK